MNIPKRGSFILSHESISLLAVGVVLILITIVATCCASLPLKQQVVTSLQASESALEASHNIERSLCSPTADQTKAITHCDGPLAASVGLTDARHHELATFYSKAFATEILAANSLKLWKAGDPKPTTLDAYQKIINDLLTAIIQFIPDAKDLVTTTQAANSAAIQTALLGNKP